MKSLTVITDNREQRPLLFPDFLVVWQRPMVKGVSWQTESRRQAPITLTVNVVKTAMQSGDYAIRNYQRLVAVERKKDIGELFNNTCTDDLPRFTRAITRFAASCTYPYLLIESLPPPLWKLPPTEVRRTVPAIDRICQCVSQLGLRLLWGGQKASDATARRRLGELVLRIMYHHTQESP